MKRKIGDTIIIADSINIVAVQFTTNYWGLEYFTITVQTSKSIIRYWNGIAWTETIYNEQDIIINDTEEGNKYWKEFVGTKEAE